jgi:hypothetical protein
MGKVFDLKSGSGSTGKPCVIYLSAYFDQVEGGTYVDKEVFNWESRFGGHLDLKPVFILEANSQLMQWPHYT